MSVRKYDYFVAGRWRNRDAIRTIVDKLRDAGKSVYCFIENQYEDKAGLVIDTSEGSDVESFMQKLETLEDWETNPTFREIFETDMRNQRNSKEFILVFPAGLSAHMELGAAYGMGKKCYGIGSPDKYETLYLMMDKVYPDVETFIEEKVKLRQSS